MECLFESVRNAKGNPGLEALRQRHVYFTMQHIIKRKNSYVVIYKKMFVHALHDTQEVLRCLDASIWLQSISHPRIVLLHGERVRLHLFFLVMI